MINKIKTNSEQLYKKINVKNDCTKKIEKHIHIYIDGFNDKEN